MFDTTELIHQYGALGLLTVMLLQTSIVPIPWETAIFGGIALELPLSAVVFWGTIGATAGAVLCYALGRFGGYPLLDKFGKYLLITHHQVEQMEAFSLKYGALSVLLARALPFVPFKIFSIAAGLLKTPFTQFVLFTILGLVPRLLILVIIGAAIPKDKGFWLLTICVLVLLVLVKMIGSKRHRIKKPEDRSQE
jgi:membrane protein DedA with SNARE-associated domain